MGITTRMWPLRYHYYDVASAISPLGCGRCDITTAMWPLRYHHYGWRSYYSVEAALHTKPLENAAANMSSAA
ncbi:hypothetical protein POVWA2_003750 [Plasmodium ovale wallikeri]|uniref:Uncharacterized protein n=1 Tax=Plasmodium ovale wallikeri TaxID=864142 RepID=A0A1A8YJ32_PLAOA|nr:hypothetical protein POVWA2_003750 [Plasmodium ovale wallikeri]